MLSEYWVAIERCAMIQSKPAAFLISDQPIVLARAADGSILALEDRCPHQSVPLSLGRMTAAGLMCRFHGWTFDGRGRCASMPGMASDLIAEVRIRHYEVREQQSLVWISRSPTALMPACMSEETSMRFLWERRYRESASQLQSRLSEKFFSDGYVVQIDAPALLGCTVRISLCITPETAVSCRVFALAHVESGRLPQWLAETLARSVVRRFSQAPEFLGGDLLLKYRR